MATLYLRRAAVAAAATLAVVSAVLLGGHQSAEASMATHFVGSVADVSTIGRDIMNAYYLNKAELNLPLPEKVMERHRSALRTGKEPTRWPDVFYAKLEVKAPDAVAPPPMIHTFYDSPNDRMMNIFIPQLPQGVVPGLIKDAERRPENYGLSMKRTIRAFQQQDDKTGLVDMLDGNLFFPDTAVWMLFKPNWIITFSRSVPFCVSRAAPQHIVPPPDVMAGAKYLGQEEVNGVNCDVYAKGSGPAPFDKKPFVTLYENAETGVPVRFVTFEDIEINVQKFKPNEGLDDDDWKTPEYCNNDAAPTPGSPLPIDQ